MKTPKQELKDLMRNSNSFEGGDGIGTAGDIGIPSKASFGLTLKKKVYQINLAKSLNDFNSTWSESQHQFDFITNPLYQTPIVTASLPSFLANTDIPVPVFGLTDYNGGYKYFSESAGFESSSIVPIAMGVVGKDNLNLDIPMLTSDGIPGAVAKDMVFPIGKPISTRNGQAVDGDLVMVYLASDGLVNGKVDWNNGSTLESYANTFYLVEVIVHSSNVAYGSLLESLVSDTFRINRLKYIVADSETAQFDNPVAMNVLSIFGAKKSDTLDIDTYKTPEQNQDGIINVPLSIMFDKRKMLWTSLIPAVDSVKWVLNVDSINKFEGGA